MTRKQANKLVKRVLIELLLSVIPPLTIVILTDWQLASGWYDFFYVFSALLFVAVGELIFMARKNKEDLKKLQKDK